MAEKRCCVLAKREFLPFIPQRNENAERKEQERNPGRKRSEKRQVPKTAALSPAGGEGGDNVSTKKKENRATAPPQRGGVDDVPLKR